MSKFCEINARFTTNGFFLTQHGCQALAESEYVNELKNNNSVKPIKQIEEVTTSFEKRFDLKKPIGILLGREVGSIISYKSTRRLRKHFPEGGPYFYSHSEP